MRPGIALATVPSFRPKFVDAVRRASSGTVSESNRWLQQLVETLAAVIGKKLRPGIHRARNCHSMRALIINLLETEIAQLLDRGQAGREARAVYRDRRDTSLGRVKGEAIAADASRLRLDDTEHCAGSDRRVNRIAAGIKHLNRRCRCQRL